ncbi:iturin family lipopeptide synthetase A [Paenibacillus sp. 4624]|uniref:amino acid adenylation domain-containing protein n=1 Tax=Paenibacillus sp. 4624 TaxID=3156453 RepID=UPI003D1A7BF4
MNSSETNRAEKDHAIAVIGMAGRFPGADNIEQFWTNLENGAESITFFSKDELAEHGIEPELLNQENYVRATGVLENAEYFDAGFFGYSARDAETMDPQIRLFMECAWEAFENAGYTPDDYEGRIGLYAGASSNVLWEYLSNMADTDDNVRFEAGQINDKDYLNSNVSYKLNLKGPSVSVFTACSTSLVAIHIACKDIIEGRCEMALAGSSSVSLPQEKGYLHQEGGISSADGHCRAFDEQASGTLLGNGLGCVILKKLSDAVADRDHIYAVIRGSAMNNDGAMKAGFSAPSVDGQVEVIRAAYEDAGVSPESVNYVETHGTATRLGDPIEVEALRLAFATDQRNYCGIGSVKTNIGHLDSAAGIASFVKTSMALKHGKIPPSLHYSNPNPYLDLDNSPFYVVSELTDWNSEGPRRAGVSSLGIGGTNVHIVMEEAPPLPVRPTSDNAKLFVLSARSEVALDQMKSNFKSYLEHNPAINLDDAAYTLQTGRKKFPYRMSFVCSSREEALDCLEADPLKRTRRMHSEVEQAKLVFMFPGQGAQYINMGLGLYKNEAVFRDELDQCFQILRNITGTDYKEILYPAENKQLEDQGLENTSLAQPLIFSFEYALTKLLIHWGMDPHAMIGYSFGEYVAACIAGVFTLEDALGITVFRGKLMHEMPAGAMLSVPLPEDQVLASLTEEVSLAVVNGQSCIVSGTVEAISAYESKMKAMKLLCTRLPVTHASHCRLTEGIVDRFHQYMRSVKLSKPSVAYISSITGGWINPDQAMDPNYWVSHLQDTVRFAKGIETLAKIPNCLFVEVGPGQDLSALTRRFVAEQHARQIVPLVRPKVNSVPDIQYILNNLGWLWINGASIRWDNLYSSQERYKVHLPAYPFERQRYWKLMDLYKKGAIGQQPVRRATKVNLTDWFYTPSWKYAKPIGGLRQAEKIPWYVFCDGFGLGEAIVESLRSQGIDVTAIYQGSAFQEKSNQTIVMQPEIEEHNARLVRIMESANSINIIHLWGLTDEADFEQIQISGLYSLVNLAKALGASRIQGAIRIQTVGDSVFEIDGTETMVPAKATVTAVSKVIPQENANIACQYVDIVKPQDNEMIRDLAGDLINEFQLNRLEPTVAYRKRKRLVQDFQAHQLTPLPSEGQEQYKDKSFYISGGLGNIGYTVAEHLAGIGATHLVLSGRTEIPGRGEWGSWLSTHGPDDHISRKIDKLKRLEALGANVHYIQADVADATLLKAEIGEFERLYGPVHGVIYSAGVTEGDSLALISSIQKTHFETQFHSKVKGLTVLEEIFKNQKLDFCIIFSSLASILGGIGFSAYAAANAYVDHFVSCHNQKMLNRWVSIDWDAWPSEKGKASGIRTTLDQYTMTYQEGIEAMFRIIDHAVMDQVVVSTGSLTTRIEQWVSQAGEENADLADSADRSYDSRPNLSSDYVGSRNASEEELVSVWEQFFGVKPIGIHDDFFELGGDSLKGINLLGKIHKRMGVRLPIAEAFKHPTIEGFARFIMNGEKDDFICLPTAPERSYYQLSAGQKQIYYMDVMAPNALRYNMPACVEIDGSVSKEQVEIAFCALVDRHEMLRATIQTVDGTPVQVIPDRHESFAIEYSVVKGEELEEKKRQFVREFDLGSGPLIRVALWKVHDQHHILMLDTHHIACDGVSTGILIDEFTRLYRGESLPPVRTRYRDYVEWQQERIASGVLADQERYWLNQFSGEIPSLDLAADGKRGSSSSYLGDKVYARVDKASTAEIMRLCKEQNVTLYMLLNAVLGTLLYRYTQQEDMVIGSAVAGRTHEDFQEVIGMFVNTIAMRHRPEGDLPFASYLQNVKSTVMEAFENQEYPFDRLVEKLSLHRENGRNPLFDIMFILQNMNIGAIELDDVVVKQSDQTVLASKFDLTLYAVEKDKEEIEFIFEYRTDLYSNEYVERLARHYINILLDVIRRPTVELGLVQMLDESELKHIRHLLSGDDRKLDESSVLEQFEKLATAYPHQVAVLCDGCEFSYSELNARANRVAAYMQHSAVESSPFIAIMVEPSIHMIAGILGILKLGKAFVPIDPKYPADRVRHILRDSCAGLILTQTHLMDLCEEENTFAIDLDALNWDLEGEITLRIERKNDNAAYMVYTSGSTGVPKGVVVGHQALSNLCGWHQEQFRIGGEDRALKYAGLGFDATVWEIFPYICSGAGIVMLPERLKLDMLGLSAFINDMGVTIAFLPTPIAERFMEIGGPSSLLTLLTGGEQLRKFTPVDYTVYNNYGPTENTVVTTCFTVERWQANIPIGRPICNVDIHILDNNLQQLPIGVPGEICISGKGLANGYWNNPDLTNAKFVMHPLDRNIRLYRTGDMGRLLPDGQIEYLGRIDSQVKVNGVRIELGEIATIFIQHNAVRDCVVDAVRNRDNMLDLTAYIVSEQQLTLDELLPFLKKQLPVHMIPSHIVQVADIPINANGKVDQKALTSAEGVKLVRQHGEIIPCSTDTEHKLHAVWKEVLNYNDEFGTESNFFELGGNSMRAITLVTAVKEAFQVELPLSRIFNQASLQEMAEEIERLPKAEAWSRISIAPKADHYPLTPSQKRMYLLQQMNEQSMDYNIPFVLSLEGEIDIERFQHAFEALFAKHEALRTEFTVIQDQIVQKVRDEVDCQVQYEEIEEPHGMQDVLKRFLRPFDLTKAPLCRVVLVKTGDKKHLLIIDIHHIVSDGESVKILLKDFTALYKGEDTRTRSTSYMDYATWLDSNEQRALLSRQADFWLTALDQVPYLQIPTDFPREKKLVSGSELCKATLNEEYTSKLMRLSRKHQVTPFMIMWNSFHILLAKYSGQNDFAIGTPVAGRRHTDIQNCVGLFVNSLALRHHLDESDTFLSGLLKAKHSIISAFDHQDYPFDEIVRKLGDSGANRLMPVFNTMFFHQSLADQSLELPDLTVRSEDFHNGALKAEILLTAIEQHQDITFQLEYAVDLFRKDTASRMLDRYIEILKQALDNENIGIGEMTLSSDRSVAKSVLLPELLDDFVF